MVCGSLLVRAMGVKKLVLKIIKESVGVAVKTTAGWTLDFLVFYIVSRSFRVNPIEELRDRSKGKSSKKVTKIIIMTMSVIS